MTLQQKSCLEIQFSVILLRFIVGSCQFNYKIYVIRRGERDFYPVLIFSLLRVSQCRSTSLCYTRLTV
jgi:hypothetical protein